MSNSVTIQGEDVVAHSIHTGGLNSSDPIYLYKSGIEEKKCLLKFGYTYPTGADYAGKTVPSYILSATLRLNITSNTSSADTQINVYRCKRYFRVYGTWGSYDGVNPWQVEGGVGELDRDSVDRCSGRILSTESGTMIELALDRRLIQGWASGDFENYGLFLETSIEGTNVVMDVDSSTPALVLEYSDPFLYGPDLVFEKSINYKTVVSVSESGIEQRYRRWQTPVRSWKMRFDTRSASDTAYGGMTELYNFFMERAGQYEPFFFVPPGETTPVAVRFAKDQMSCEHFSYQLYRMGVELVEVLDG